MTESIEYKGCTINVEYDPEPTSPRTDCDNASEMICAHQRYNNSFCIFAIIVL